jgi:hypothetical protein
VVQERCFDRAPARRRWWVADSNGLVRKVVTIRGRERPVPTLSSGQVVDRRRLDSGLNDLQCQDSEFDSVEVLSSTRIGKALAQTPAR